MGRSVTPRGNSSRGADFTQGSIARHLVRFAWPMFVGNLLQALYSTVDSFWVGRFIGPEALAAVSVGMPILFALTSFVGGITIATSVLVAQYTGARDPARVKRIIGNSFTWLSAAALIITVLGVAFRAQILQLINTPPEIMTPATQFLALFLLGTLPMFVVNTAGAILRGIGDSRTALVWLIYATVLNTVLDPLFIFGVGPLPQMGVGGAALATTLAQCIAAAIAVIDLSRRGMWSWAIADWLPVRDITAQTVRIGFPAGVQQTVVSLSILAVNSISNGFGKTVVAGFGAASRWDGFAFLPAFSVSLAVSAVVGQNLGAGRPERVKESLRAALLLGVGITLGVSLVVVALPVPLLKLFTTDAGVIAVGTHYLHIIGASYALFAVMFVFQGVLRGAGDTFASLMVTIFSLWIIRVPLARWFSAQPKLGYDGVLLAVALSPLLGAFFVWGYYATGRWKRKVVVKVTPSAVGASGGEAAQEATVVRHAVQDVEPGGAGVAK